ERPDPVRGWDSRAKTDLAPDAATQGDPFDSARGARRDRGGPGKDDGQGRRPALPNAVGSGPGAGTVDTDADPAAAGKRNDATQPGGDGTAGHRADPGRCPAPKLRP